METEILLAGLATIGLVIYSFTKWAIKGEFFHPGFIYSLINGGIFIVFAFGPYEYTYKIYSSYYYMYVFMIYVFVTGIVWGSVNGHKRLVKDIRLKSLHLLIVYTLSIILTLVAIVPTILASQGTLEGAVDNRFEQIEYESDQANSNPILFIFQNLELSFSLLSTALITAYAVWQRRNYKRIVVLFLLVIFRGLFANSRGTIVFGAIVIFVPIYIFFKESGFIKFNNLKKLINFKWAIPAIALTIVTIVLLTNVRSSTRVGDLEISYKAIEAVYKAKSKPWFDNFANNLPPELVNPIAQLSLYAGGTVSFGGIATDIVVDSGLKTWGTRSLNPVHRILERLSLDGGLARRSRQNYFEILDRGPGGFSYSWWGDPANFMVDFGLIGAPLASMTIGWLIGWIYGRISNSGPILKATGTAIILKSLILTPAFSPFSDFSNFISLVVIGYYLLNQSYKKLTGKGYLAARIQR